MPRKIVSKKASLVILLTLFIPTFLFAETGLLKSEKAIVPANTAQDIPSSRDEDNKIITETNGAENYFKQGYDHLYRGEYNKAISYFEKAVILEPDYAEAYAYTGLAYYYLKDNYLAKENFQKAKELKNGKGYDRVANFVNHYLQSFADGQVENEIKQKGDVLEEFLENKKDNIAARVTLFAIRHPLGSALSEVLFTIIVISCTLCLLKIARVEIPRPVSIVAGIQFESGITGFLAWFYFKEMASLFPGSGGPFGAFTTLVTIGGGLLQIFLGILVLNLINWARKATLCLMLIACLSGLIRSSLGGFSNQLENYSLGLLVIEAIIFYFCLDKEYFKAKVY